MSTLVLPQSMVADRDAGIKANAQHVDDNFDALTNAVNGKLDLDGSSTPTADISMASHKLTNVATPTLSGDAATKGYLDSELNAYSARNLTFTGTVNATTQATSDNSTKVATTEFVIDILKAMYPVGTGVFVGTGNTCPMAALFGTWELVAQDKALWTGDGTNGGTTIAAGLPNITGSSKGYITSASTSASGAMQMSGGSYKDATSQGGYWLEGKTLSIDASLSSSIYGASSTVQPPAYVVNVWRRTA